MNDLNYPADVLEQVEMLGDEFTIEGDVTISLASTDVTIDMVAWDPDIPWDYT